MIANESRFEEKRTECFSVFNLIGGCDWRTKLERDI
jgi:hypothetical protein